MAAAEETASSPGDPYATNKANLRDTIKWLAAIFGALAAVVVAGTPLSGLGALPIGLQMGAASLALVVAFGCICGALVLMLRLLRSDLLYALDIDPRVDAKTREHSHEVDEVRDDIEAHRLDLIPDYPSLTDFLKRIDAEIAHAKKLGQTLEALNQAVPRSARAVAKAQAAYDAQLKVVRDFRAYQQRLLAYATYWRFYGRLRKATPVLLGLGIGALLSLMAFTLAVQRPKEEHGPEVVVVPVIDVRPVAVAASGPAPAPVLGSVFFATGSAVLSAEARKAIERARDEVSKRPGAALLLMARTDMVGTLTRNRTLARERADAVRDVLVKPGGLAPSRVFFAPLPKDDLPRITADGEESEANRTVSLHIVDLPR